MLPAGAIPQKMTSQLPSPEELMQGFQKHQAQKLQVASHWPLAPSGHCPVNNYDAARAGIQCYMDLAGNIRQVNEHGILSALHSDIYHMPFCVYLCVLTCSMFRNSLSNKGDPVRDNM